MYNRSTEGDSLSILESTRSIPHPFSQTCVGEVLSRGRPQQQQWQSAGQCLRSATSDLSEQRSPASSSSAQRRWEQRIAPPGMHPDKQGKLDIKTRCSNSVDQPTDRSTDRSTDRAIDRPTDRMTDRRTDPSNDRLAGGTIVRLFRFYAFPAACLFSSNPLDAMRTVS